MQLQTDVRQEQQAKAQVEEAKAHEAGAPNRKAGNAATRPSPDSC